jgi:hypothetical protein
MIESVELGAGAGFGATDARGGGAAGMGLGAGAATGAGAGAGTGAGVGAGTALTRRSALAPRRVTLCEDGEGHGLVVQVAGAHSVGSELTVRIEADDLGVLGKCALNGLDLFVDAIAEDEPATDARNGDGEHVRVLRLFAGLDGPSSPRPTRRRRADRSPPSSAAPATPRGRPPRTSSIARLRPRRAAFERESSCPNRSASSRAETEPRRRPGRLHEERIDIRGVELT